MLAYSLNATLCMDARLSGEASGHFAVKIFFVKCTLAAGNNCYVEPYLVEFENGHDYRHLSDDAFVDCRCSPSYPAALETVGVR